jgi:uncharacterized membrane protein HdeD (DUF308 family)
MLAVRGAAGVVFGIVAFAWMPYTSSALSVLFATYLLVNGAFALIGSPGGHPWAMKVEGAVDLFASPLILGWPGMYPQVPTLPVATWAVAAGSAQIWTAVQLQGFGAYEWPLLLAGITTITLALVCVAYRGSPISWCFALVGEYAVVFGEFSLVMGFGLLGSRRRRAGMG